MESDNIFWYISMCYYILLHTSRVYSYEIRSFDVVQDSHSYHNKIERYQVWRISSEVMGVFPPCILL